VRQLSILHVEDDDAAALLVQVALQEALPDVRYRRASDVDNALTLLSANTKDPAISAPGLILLDLNLRRKSGFEMLKALRESPHLARLCVVVFTSSAAAADRKIALELGASAYLTKPSIFDDYVIAMHEIVKFAEH
jgi:two-component system, chemotaxis family, response regulator Rcp1